jgi:hypothetical protein
MTKTTRAALQHECVIRYLRLFRELRAQDIRRHLINHKLIKNDRRNIRVSAFATAAILTRLRKAGLIEPGRESRTWRATPAAWWEEGFSPRTTRWRTS